MKHTMTVDHGDPASRSARVRNGLADWGLPVFCALFLIVSVSDSADAKKRCRSEAYEKEDAIEYCAGVLGCDEEDVKCRGTARRWICTCEADESESEQPQMHFQFDFGFGGRHEDGHDEHDGSGGGFRLDIR